MSIEIRIADSDEVKAAMKAALEPLYLENHKLRTLLEASDQHHAMLKEALRASLTLLDGFASEVADLTKLAQRILETSQLPDAETSAAMRRYAQGTELLASHVAELRKLVES